MAHCHCSRCRKAGGSTSVMIRARDFRWIQGSELVTRFEPEPPFDLIRCFCRVCGTYLGEPDSHPEVFPLSAHAFDDDPQVRPVLHEQVSGKPSWYEILDELPQYDADPPLAALFPDSRKP